MLFCVVLNQKGAAALKANKRAKVNDNLKQQFYNYCICLLYTSDAADECVNV